MGRSNFSLSKHPLLQPFNRVILAVTMHAKPTVIMDGIITHQQLLPGSEPGTSMLMVTGEDVSVMMDLTQKNIEYLPLPDLALATTVIGRYAEYGLVPMPVPPPVDNTPSIDEPPYQDGTDLAYLQELAAAYAYVFYIIPGPVPGTNRAYWGPRIRPGLPQSALSVDLGPSTNVDQITFEYNGLAP